jgi:cobalt/nickel transport system ATP-binding protein
VQQAADLCEIPHLLERPTHALSSGEKARVALAGVLAMEPELLVADELLSSLDPWMRLTIFDILQKLYDQGKTILLATHDLSVVRYWASYVLVLQAGQIAFAGRPDKLLNSRELLDATELSPVWWDVRLDYPEGGRVKGEE